MKLSVNWLKQYVSDMENVSVAELSSKLTLAGLEVEGIEEKKGINNLVTVKVLTCVKHPNADKLNLCTVTDGKDTHQIVCGATNVEVGIIAILAKVGAVFPHITMKEAEIRGIKSEGMMCSEKDLGISEEHDGIILLPENTEIGIDANDIVGLDDTIFELNVTPNRPDWLSAVGVAREVAAIFDKQAKLPFLDILENNEKASDISSITVENKDYCPIYYARVIKGVKISQSPLYIQKRLRASGLRPINNVVDITNYILLEYNQPLHAFDLRHIDRGIIVRNAKDKEKITTLDGKERELSATMLVIADHSRPLAIAGVMGGELSSVSNDTKDILLECAYFDPNSVRVTSKTLGLSSDSSYRYERGIDFGNVSNMVDYSAQMIANICGGVVLAGKLGGVNKHIKNATILTPYGYVNDLLGTDIQPFEMVKILNRLNMQSKLLDDDIITEVPSYRGDITRPCDIAEEVARLYGYDNIEVAPIANEGKEALTPLLRNVKDIRNRLATLGFNEAVNFSFVAPEYIASFDKNSDNFVKLLNPISVDMAYMRTLVFPSIIKNMQTNYNSGERCIKLFEMSSTFISNGVDKLATEETKLAFGVMGNFMPTSWIKQDNADMFFYLKGVLDNILSSLSLEGKYERLTDVDFLHSGKAAKIYVEGEEIGFLGAIHPLMLEKFDLKASVYVCEVNFYKLSKLAESTKIKYHKFSRFPSVERDISLVLPDNVASVALLEVISKFNPLIIDVKVFDNYKGKGIDEQLKSLAYRITFSDITKTLTDVEINTIISDLLKVLSDKFEAQLR